MRIKSLRLFSCFLILISILGCQRDDICPESAETTPLLIIRFYDVEEPTESRAPQNMLVKATDIDTIFDRFSQDSIAIPLRTDRDISEFVFTLNAPLNPDDEEQENMANSDTISFSYGREEEYINRACAYKIRYVGLRIQLQDEPEDGNWIQEIQIEETNVEDQNQAHVSIFF